MESSSSPSDLVLLEELRRRRGELRESMDALEGALAWPARVDPVRWAERVHVALVELSGDFREHIEITEGPEGIHGDLVASSPRLAGPVEGLTREHDVIRRHLDGLLARVALPDAGEDVDRVRDLGTALLGRLVRHRQRGADLVFEAYEYDIGGET
jgi:Hemerythrin HHE cation binding domain